MDLEIRIRQGIGDVRFDMPVEDVVEIMGEATSVEQIENAIDESTTVLHYDNEGLTLFFEGENPTLTAIDIANEEATLFGEEIFDLEPDEMANLMKGNGLTKRDDEDEDWGEHRMSFIDGNIDFYFEDDYLMSINLGK